MKQLKFMIAAAAAIGLAGAAQAAFPSETEKDAPGNTGFEEFDAETDVTTDTSETASGDSYFWYTGDVAADNESKIIAGQSGLAKAPRAKGAKFDDNANVLQVNTGTAPLLRTINRVTTNEGVSSAEPVTVPETGIYIDTLVQFTVTPAGDTVMPGEDDKLMIYLQEVADDADTTEVNEAATNLVVVAGYTEDGETVIRDEYKVPGTFEAGQWYRLTVRSFDGIYSGDLASTVIPAFTISIDGNPCAYDKVAFRGEVAEELIAGNAKESVAEFVESGTLVLSLKQTATLKAVGFAGEGLVDDIVFSTTQEELETSVDFTLSVVGATAVKAVIGENNEVEWAQGKFSLPAGTTTFTIQYTPVTAEALWNPTYTAALSEAENCTFKDLTVTLGSGAPSATLTVTATEVGSAPTVGENATAESVGITTPAFTDVTGAALKKVVDWAVAKGVSKAALNAMPPFEANTGNATNEMQEAFLLNCAVSEVATAKAAFKFTEFTPGDVPAVFEPSPLLKVFGGEIEAVRTGGKKDEFVPEHSMFRVEIVPDEKISFQSGRTLRVLVRNREILFDKLVVYILNFLRQEF